MKSQMMRRLLSLALIAIFASALAPKAFAACTAPVGAEGAIVYNDTFNIPQYCDGTTWYTFGSGSYSIADDSVTFAKIQNITTSRLLGRFTAGSGDAEEISLGAGLSLNTTTGVLSAPGSGLVSDGNKGDITVSGTGTVWDINANAVGTTEIAANAVTTAKITDANVTYAKIQNVASGAIMGRYSAASGVVQELTLGSGLSLNTTTGVITATGSGGTVTGTGTTNYVPKWTSATALGNSVIAENGSNIGIGTTGAAYPLVVATTTANANVAIQTTNGTPASAALRFADGSSTRALINWDFVNSRYQFYAGGTTGSDVKMVLGADGTVGIGTGITTMRGFDTGTTTMSGAANDYTKGQFNITGGGTVTWIAGKLKWTARIIAMGMGQSSASAGYVEFNNPASAIPAANVYDGAARAADTATGVTLGAWETLWGVHTVGGAQSAIAYYITRYTVPMNAPSNWFMIATMNGDDNSLRLGNGVSIPNGGTWVASTGTIGGGVSDGNKGDITVSASGATWNINANAVDTAEIAANAVTTAKITDANVTFAKLTSATAASRLLGRGSAAGAGAFQELTLGAGLTMTGTVLSASSGGGGFFVDAGSNNINNSNTGNVGIGTTTPTSKLDVNGGIRLGNDSNTCVVAKVGTLRFNTDNKMQICINTAEGYEWTDLGVVVGTVTTTPEEVPITTYWPHAIKCAVGAEERYYYLERALISTTKRRQYKAPYGNNRVYFEPSGAFIDADIGANTDCEDKSIATLTAEGKTWSFTSGTASTMRTTPISWPDAVVCTYSNQYRTYWISGVTSGNVVYREHHGGYDIHYNATTGAFASNNLTTDCSSIAITALGAAKKFNVVGGPATKSMIADIPDALVCTDGTGDQWLMLRGLTNDVASNTQYYRFNEPHSSDNYYVYYRSSTKQFLGGNLPGGSNCNNKTLDELRSEGIGQLLADNGTTANPPPSTTPPVAQSGLPLSGDTLWPDVVICKSNTNPTQQWDVLMYGRAEPDGRRYYYSYSSYYISWWADGTWGASYSNGGSPLSTSDCLNQTMQNLKLAGKTFNFRDNVTPADMNFGGAYSWPFAITCSDTDSDYVFRLFYGNGATYQYYYAHGVNSYYHSYTPGVGQNGTTSTSNAGNCYSPTNYSMPQMKALSGRTWNWRGGADTGSMFAGIPDAFVCTYTNTGAKIVYYLWKHYKGAGTGGYHEYRQSNQNYIRFATQAPYTWYASGSETASDCAYKSIAQLNAEGKAVFLVETANKDQVPGAYDPKGGSMVDGWPDVLLCRSETGSRPYIYYYSYQDNSYTYYYSGTFYYSGYYSYPSYMRFNNNKTYYDKGGDVNNECVGQTITSLQTMGLAFNFGGGGGGSSNAAKAGGVDMAIQFNDQDNLAGGNLFWDKATNRMGLGTGTPTVDFDIVKSQNATTGIRIHNTDTTDNASKGGVYLTAGTVAATFEAVHTEGLYVGTTSNHPVMVETNNAVRMTVTAAGNVGIGVTAPQAKLDISGGVKLANDAATCVGVPAKYGTLRYTGTALEICQAGGWAAVDATNGGSSSSPWVTNAPNIYFNTGRALISTTGGTSPDASAALEIQSTTKGFLPPRMTETQRNAITAPVDGLIVYNTTVSQLQFYAGGLWQQIGVAGTSNTAGTANQRLQFLGYGNSGAPGDGTSSNYAWPTMVSNASLNHSTIVSFDAGGYGNASNVAACVITSAGSNNMWCWGNSYTNINGAGSDVNLPSQITGYTWKNVSIGLGLVACGVTTANAGYCWGYQQYFGLGNNVNAGSYLYTPQAIVGVSPPGGWDHISVGGYYPVGTAHYAIACGISMTGNRMWCWGSDVWGQIGNGVGGPNPTQPVEVTTLAGQWARVRAGGNHVCARTLSNQLYCWGYGDHGQIGNGVAASVDAPTLVPLPSGVTSWADFETGAKHNCAIANTGSLYCWGQNNYGQIGDGTATQRNSPTLVVGGKRWKEVSVGDLLTCATDTNSRMWCWGYNAQGQLGNGTTTTNYLPQPVYGDDTVLDFSLGNYGSYRLVQ